MIAQSNLSADFIVNRFSKTHCCCTIRNIDDVLFYLRDYSFECIRFRYEAAIVFSIHLECSHHL